MNEKKSWFLVFDFGYPEKFCGAFRSLRDAIQAARDPNAPSDILDTALTLGSDLGPVVDPKDNDPAMVVNDRVIYRFVLPDPPPRCKQCSRNAVDMLSRACYGEWVCDVCTTNPRWHRCRACGLYFNSDAFPHTVPVCDGKQIEWHLSVCPECSEKLLGSCTIFMSRKAVECETHGTRAPVGERILDVYWAAHRLREVGCWVWYEDD